jgi:predicted regulator of Ras-like GTPase activity (Roadblock/LC7/MglB family)
MSRRCRRTDDPGEAYSIPSDWDAAAAPQECPDHFTLPVSAVLGALPEEIRHALNGSDAQTASFLIPLGELEPQLRGGRLCFKWAQIREWCSVPLDMPVAPESDIELPLDAVVPIFLASRAESAARRQVEVDTRIPDVFSKSRFSSRVHAAPAVTTPALAEPEQKPPPPSPAPVRATPPPEPFRPAHTATVPAQVIEYLRKLDGVTGAFIATADGLLVAGDVPNANENVLAAFAPTVFAQLTKYADMAQLGSPESIDVNLDDGGTVHVRKAGKLYLGVLVPRDRPLPLRDLTRLSIALQPHTS